MKMLPISVILAAVCSASYVYADDTSLDSLDSDYLNRMNSLLAIQDAQAKANNATISQNQTTSSQANAINLSN